VKAGAYTGLRAGELVALRVRHLNLLRGRCEVGESATEVDGRLVWGPTKTYARRTVPLPRFLSDQLAAYLAGRPHGPDDLVFTAPQGGPLREQKFVAGIFKPAAARAGFPHRLRFHDLRHTCASLLIAQGASVKAVQAQLGHASATVTLDRCGHLFPDELQRLADRLQDAYADAVADPARTKGAETMLGASKGAGQRPAPGGGGGETRTLARLLKGCLVAAVLAG
jgi:integrase